jgi:hypothetical protein
MITLDQIISSNLDMLKEQAASLEKSLDFVRKAIELFESQNGSQVTAGKSGKKRGRKPGSVVTKAAKTVKTAPQTRKRKGGKHIDRILTLLKGKGPQSSGELIEALFKEQTKDKNKQHFGTLIYPVLTKAYKSRTLRLKDGKIHLSS